jgi:opacity protein-like surface antigen
MQRLILIFCASAAAASGQFVSFGFKGGVPAMDAIPAGQFGGTLHTGRWTLGPTVEFRLFPHLSFEVDALFRGFDIKSNGVTPAHEGVAASVYAYRNDVKAWDVPFLLKYRILTRRISPFVNAGVSITHQSADYSSNVTCQPRPGESCTSPDGIRLDSHSDYSESLNRRGLVAGGGVEFKYGRVTLAPEFRYTRLHNLGTNQATVLFGVRF